MAEPTDVLAGGGENGARMRAIDWSKTPLGPVASWPQSLKTCVRIILTSRQPMFVWWGDALINLYNDAYQSIVGGKHPAALGQPASIVWREIWNEVGPRSAKAMRENEGTYDEALLLVMERNGYPEETYYTFSYSPVPNDSGGTGGLICANTDDTQRIVGERQLALLRDLAAATAEARTVAEVCTLAAKALATDPRDLPFALLYLGEPQLGLAASTLPEAHTLTDPSIWSSALADTMQRHATTRIELGDRPGTPTGGWPEPPREAALIPIGAAGVMIVGLSRYRLFEGGYRDFLELAARQIEASIANAKAYEDERKKSDALAEIDRAKTAFFSNVSHEFRTPLTLMLGPAEDLLAGAHGPLREAQRREIELLQRNGLRLQRLVNTLLDFSRIEAGRVDASYRPTDVSALTAELASVFRSAIEKAGVRLVVDCPPLGESAYLDRSMWEKIVFNLLSNALKFTFEGEIGVEVRRVGGSFELEIRDSGVGVSAPEVPRLFERFHRITGGKARSHEGSGIGLALVQELARLHGGSVRAESEVGVGTRFFVTVPFGSAHLPQDRIASDGESFDRVRGDAYVDEAMRWLGEEGSTEERPSAPFPASFTGPRAEIVLADDNTDMREYVQRLLSTRYDVRAYADGKAALASIAARRPDLVLTDVMMPVLDGFGLLSALRSEPTTRTIPVVMLSARAGEEAKVEGLEAGADDYLVKPFSARELLARVGARIEIARVRGEAEIERAKLHALFMNAPAVIAVLRGPTHVFELVNEPYLELVQRRDILGKTVREVLPETESQGYFALLDRVFREGITHVGRESRLLVNTPGGAPREVFLNFVYAPYSGTDDVIQGVALYGFDVTDQVLARRHAEAATAARDDFLSVASHELRTPITSMSLQAILAGRILAKLPDSERAIEKLRAMQVQIKRLENLIDGLLDVSRIAAGRLALELEQVDLAPLLRDVVERHNEQAAKAGSTIALEIEGAITGQWDPLRLDQVITNLLTNAIKYGNGRPIEIRATKIDGLPRVVVRDHGIGIAPDDLARLYGRFERFVPSKNYSGLGLGLWIVRNIIDAMGGHIDVQSVVGAGTTFTLDLPRS